MTAAPPVEADWRRLHPLTPLLRGGRVLAVLVLGSGQAGLRQESPKAVLAVVAVAVVLGLVVGAVAWRTTRYRLTATELQVDSGLLTKRQRRVPLARLQSVDVVRPLLARVLGLAELRLEVAGGGSTEAPLAYLSDDDAQALRARLLRLSRGEQDDAAPPVPEHVLVTVPTGPLVAATALAGPVPTAVVLLVLLAVVAAVDVRAALAAAVGGLPLVLGVVTTYGRRVLDEHGFTVAEAPDGLHLRHGLLDTRSAAIPTGRVQAVRLHQPVLWRPFGWVRVDVDVAGYAAGRGDEEAATSALLPVAPRALAEALVPRVLGTALPVADRPVPARARWRAPVQARRLRLGVDDRHVVVRSGVLATTTTVVPIGRAQSLRLVQGPWQRRLRLATVAVDGAGRRLRGAVAPHRDAAEARALLDELAATARRARVVSSPGSPS